MKSRWLPIFNKQGKVTLPTAPTAESTTKSTTPSMVTMMPVMMSRVILNSKQSVQAFHPRRQQQRLLQLRHRLQLQCYNRAASYKHSMAVGHTRAGRSPRWHSQISYGLVSAHLKFAQLVGALQILELAGRTRQIRSQFSAQLGHLYEMQHRFGEQLSIRIDLAEVRTRSQ